MEAGTMSSASTKHAEEMTLAELKARATELGIEASEVEAIETWMIGAANGSMICWAAHSTDG